jgi:hypothetical protein
MEHGHHFENIPGNFLKKIFKLILQRKFSFSQNYRRNIYLATWKKIGRCRFLLTIRRLILIQEGWILKNDLIEDR